MGYWIWHLRLSEYIENYMAGKLRIIERSSDTPCSFERKNSWEVFMEIWEYTCAISNIWRVGCLKKIHSEYKPLIITPYSGDLNRFINGTIFRGCSRSVRFLCTIGLLELRSCWSFLASFSSTFTLEHHDESDVGWGGSTRCEFLECFVWLKMHKAIKKHFFWGRILLI